MKKTKHGKAFWDAEYTEAEHLALSIRQSEDLEQFTRWMEREYGRAFLNVTTSVLDLGCGNGRNLIWLAENYGIRGIGYDISTQAVASAVLRTKTLGLPLTYEERSIADTLPLPPASQSIVLDMMSSHVLTEVERKVLIQEIYRVLKPGGFLFYKTFLLEEDTHAKRMIAENPAPEANSYIHPTIGVMEHVSTQEEIEALYGELFTIHKIYKSHRHRGKNAKRRSIMVYMEKPSF